MSMVLGRVTTGRSALPQPNAEALDRAVRSVGHPPQPGYQWDTVESCLLGLNFGDYELIDASTLSAANTNLLIEEDPDQGDETSTLLARRFDRLGVPKRAFQLTEELEAEAMRRRLNAPIAIPENRFGNPLSEEFSLRFRYATSWPHGSEREGIGYRRGSAVPPSWRAAMLGVVLAALAAFTIVHH